MNLIEERTQDGWRIVRENNFPLDLSSYYYSYNEKYFDNTLPCVPVYWAKTITPPHGGHANALYVSEESPVKRRYIVLYERLSGMFPLERLCLLHEMVHVKIGSNEGHGEKFISEFKRVLDANGWTVMGCVDSPEPRESAP